jgi:ubiquinone/menaquinone biosynthesis C-methylase UbiE
MPTWESENIFSGTSPYYARYRPDYPEKLFGLLSEKFALCQKSRVLDLGCGTGQIALRIASLVAAVIAVDPQSEMLEEGKSLATGSKITNIKWLKGESSGLTAMAPEIGEINLTAIGRAFHWMDREQTLRDLYRITRPGGGLAIIGDNGPRDGQPGNPWKAIIAETVGHWLGDERKAGTKGTYSHPEKRFETTLAESQFSNLELAEIITARTWTIDGIIGYLYSTSSTSIPVLADKKEPFEKDLRQRLLSFAPDGRFEEDVITNVMMLWKKAD